MASTLAVLCFALTTFTTATVAGTQASSPGNSHETVVMKLGSVDDYPVGDPRRCLEVARKNNYSTQRFEVLPGFGWDNLRNEEQGQVISYNYSTCRTTDDGRFLLPDTVAAVPIKTSSVETFAELIEHWSNWTSTTSKSINVDAGLNFHNVGISGKFSSDFQDMKAKQIGDKSVSTRAQVRYVRYSVQLQPDSPLHPVFRGRLLDIAAAHELNETEQARYLSQLLVRDFGTHVTTRAWAGAALMQVDHVRDEWVNSQSSKKSDILASASLSLFSIFHMSASYETKTYEAFMKSYLAQRTSSVVKTLGGTLFKPTNFTSDMWAQDVDKDLVALDRAGDPLYFLITERALPELPASTLSELMGSVRDAIELYYAFNVFPGCLDRQSPNFNPAANVEDGTCKPAPSNLTFGGMFQTCTMAPGSNDGNLCGNMSQVNPMTGGFSCPPLYEAVKLHEGKMQNSRSEHSCHRCYLFFHCCDDHYFHSSATYQTYWCAATKGPVPQHTGYLFGGLYTSHLVNPVSRSMSCPPAFYPLRVGLGGDIYVCISDDYEMGAEYALPFAGFISCDMGNPLAVAAKPGAPKAIGQDHSLRAFFSGQASSYPHRCPDGFSKHLAAVDQGCQINYCVQTGAMSDPYLPHVKRPPYIPPPSLPAPPMENLVIFDKVSRTWHKNAKAQEYQRQLQLEFGAEITNDVSSNHGGGSSSSSSSSMSAGTAAGVTFGATVGCVLVATLIIMAVRAKRHRSEAGRGGYRRLQNPLLSPTGEYGAVSTAATAAHSPSYASSSSSSSSASAGRLQVSVNLENDE